VAEAVEFSNGPNKECPRLYLEAIQKQDNPTSFTATAILLTKLKSPWEMCTKTRLSEGIRSSDLELQTQPVGTMNSSHARLSCMTLEASRLRWSLFRRITLYGRPQIFCSLWRLGQFNVGTWTWGTSTSPPPSPPPELREEGLLRLGNISYYVTDTKKKWTHYGLFSIKDS
jgi:hypothetical protein